MNRRAFLGNMIGGLSAAAAVRTWPFRVFSFPSQIHRVQPLIMRSYASTFAVTEADLLLDIDDFSERFIRPAIANLSKEWDVYSAAQ